MYLGWRSVNAPEAVDSVRVRLRTVGGVRQGARFADKPSSTHCDIQKGEQLKTSFFAHC